MLHPKVNNLRYYDEIGYYSVFDDLELEDFTGGKYLGEEFDDLEGNLRSEFMAISTIEQKLKHDLHYESKEIMCFVKKSTFGYQALMEASPNQSVHRQIDANSKNSKEESSIPYSSIAKFDSIYKGSSYGGAPGYLFEEPGEFMGLLDEFLARSYLLKQENAEKREEKKLQKLEDERKMKGTYSDSSPSKSINLPPKVKLRTEESEEPEKEDFEFTEPDWNAVIAPEFLEDKYQFFPEYSHFLKVSQPKQSQQEQEVLDKVQMDNLSDKTPRNLTLTPKQTNRILLRTKSIPVDKPEFQSELIGKPDKESKSFTKKWTLTENKMKDGDQNENESELLTKQNIQMDFGE